MNITIKEHRYIGYLQGFKVWIDGQKFPKQKGYFYTAMRREKAVQDAIADYRKGVK